MGLSRHVGTAEVWTFVVRFVWVGCLGLLGM